MIGQPICSELDYRNAGRNPAIRRSMIESVRERKRQYLMVSLLLFFSSFAQLAFVFWFIRSSEGQLMWVVPLMFSITSFLNLFCCGLMIMEKRLLDSQLKMMAMIDGLASKFEDLSTPTAGQQPAEPLLESFNP